jgi:hypothetical protein
LSKCITGGFSKREFDAPIMCFSLVSCVQLLQVD